MEMKKTRTRKNSKLSKKITKKRTKVLKGGEVKYGGPVSAPRYTAPAVPVSIYRYNPSAASYREEFTDPKLERAKKKH
jgi:hypothetical protein